MVERGKGGGRTQVWPPRTETWRRRGPAFADHLARFAGSTAGHIKEWSLADVGPRRLDRNLSREAGALALRWNGASFDMIRARPRNHDRPWARSSVGSGENAERSPLSRPLARDATPRTEDLEAGD